MVQHYLVKYILILVFISQLACEPITLFTLG